MFTKKRKAGLLPKRQGQPKRENSADGTMSTIIKTGIEPGPDVLRRSGDHRREPFFAPKRARYIVPWKLKDGSSAIIRPICPEDEPLMVKFHETLSERSVYLRYFTALKLDERIAHERLSRICFIDYDREMVLVVQRGGLRNGPPEILGVGRLSKLDETSEAEFAIVISDPWQGQGLGTQLLRMLVQVSRDEKLERITATILSSNHAMQQLARKAGFELKRDPGASEVQATLFL